MRKMTCLLLVAGCFASNNLFAQQRFQSDVFNTIDSITNIQFGEATNIKNKEEKLLLDIVMPPSADTMKRRPLVIFIHGGGFQNNSKIGSLSNMVCQSFARKGYVTATIDYRLGVEGQKTNADYANALYRAQQDGKAAIRFFRKHADKYGIDTAQIFITGGSAGSKTCLAIAYMNEHEIPESVDVKRWGSLEGNSGNAGYSSRVHGVMNNWGSIINYEWINKGDAPLFNVAGTADKTVPFDSSYDYHGFKYGPYILYQRCLQVGVPTGWRPFEGAGHTLDNNKTKQDSCIRSMAGWLFAQLAINKGKNDEGVYRWEKDINVFDSLNAAEKYSKKSILLVGSSYIRMWKNIRQDLKYTNIIHRGFGGCNLRDVAYYIHRITDPVQPKAVFIYVGNDIVGTNKDKAPEQVLELYKYVVKEIQSKHPSIPITWLEISPSERRWMVWDKVSEANRLIREYSGTQTGLYCIASSDSFLGKDGKPITSLYLSDKLHYNEEGYKVWGNSIRKQVLKISKK